MRSILSSLTAALAGTRVSKPANIFSLFVFGDSYTDTGYRVSSPYPTLPQPFGYPLIGHNASQHYLDGPQIHANTSANGPVWPQYLTLAHNTTPTLLYDFAVGGATIPDSLTDQILTVYSPRFSHLFSPKHPNTQLKNGATTWSSETSLFATFIGINDINDCGIIFHPRTRVPMEECLRPRFEFQLFAMVGELYRTGARRFLFVNIPPLGRSPFVRFWGGKAVRNYGEGVRVVNEVLLPGLVRAVEGRFEGVEVVVYDAWEVFGRVLDQPKRYGFTDGECVVDGDDKDGKECVWADWFHPSTKMHDILARGVRDQLKESHKWEL